jgi:hypothetical protein
VYIALENSITTHILRVAAAWYHTAINLGYNTRILCVFFFALLGEKEHTINVKYNAAGHPGLVEGRDEGSTFPSFVARFCPRRAQKRTTDAMGNTMLLQAKRRFRTAPRKSCK